MFRRIKRILELKPQMVLNNGATQTAWCFYFGEAMSPISTHQSMFTKTIESLASPEQ